MPTTRICEWKGAQDREHGDRQGIVTDRDARVDGGQEIVTFPSGDPGGEQLVLAVPVLAPTAPWSPSSARGGQLANITEVHIRRKARFSGGSKEARLAGHRVLETTVRPSCQVTAWIAENEDGRGRAPIRVF